jgi:hypothetical protein
VRVLTAPADLRLAWAREYSMALAMRTERSVGVRCSVDVVGRWSEDPESCSR